MYVYAIARRTKHGLTATVETSVATSEEDWIGETEMDNDGYQPTDETAGASKKGGPAAGFDDVDLSVSAHHGKSKYDLEKANKTATPAGEEKRDVPSLWFIFMVILLAIGFGLALALGLTLGHPDPMLDPYQFSQGAVASDHRLCSEVGRDILKNGGIAVDAAISTAFCLGVLNLQAGGIGGGGYLVFYNKTFTSTVAVDAQVVAPTDARSDMFQSNAAAASTGGLAIAVPGEVSGLYMAHKSLGGKLAWASLLEPSIRLAKKGFAIGQALADAIAANEVVILAEPSLKEILATGGAVKQRGDMVQLPKLAASLEIIAEMGADGFYKGDLAKKIVADISEIGGNITLKDLEKYSALSSDALSVELGGGQLYGGGGVRVYAPPPPSSGIVTNFILNILEVYDLNWRNIDNTEKQVETYHAMLESFKFAFAERTKLGDPEFVESINDEYIEKLLMKSKAVEISNMIGTRALLFAEYESKYAPQADTAGGATHVSVRDSMGNAVSYTSSISLDFGSKMRGNRTGIMFNAGMGDFSLPNGTVVEGKKPSLANYIAPGKRPLSAMSPLVLVDKDDEVKAVIGSSGGTEMITSTAMMAAQILWFEENVIDAMNRSRIHADLTVKDRSVIYDHEAGLESEIVSGLSSRGQVESQSSSLTSSVNIIMQTKKNRWYTNADKRVPGSGYAHY